MKAIASIRELKQDISVKIETKHENGSEITHIGSDASTGVLFNQIKNLVVPPDSQLSRVKVFSSADNSLSLNIFSFESLSAATKSATKEDAKGIFEFIEEIKSGKHANDSSVPKYSELFSEKSMTDYLTKVSPSYAHNSTPRRFLIQRELYEKVRGTESAVVQVEQSKEDGAASWISIAAANTLPEVLLRLSSSMLASRHIDITRCHLDVVRDPENATDTIPGFVSMLRLRVVDARHPGVSIDHNTESFRQLMKDLKRAKWLDDEVTDMGLNKFPHLGVDKAEIIVALCSMLHGPLYKVNAQAFSSIRSTVQILAGSVHFMQLAETIAQLFMDRFNVKEPLSDSQFEGRCHDITARINKLQHEAAKTLLNKMLDAVKASLRTNLYHEDRYSLGIRLNPTIMATGDIGQPGGRPYPFGIVFAHGRHFNGFHNRFRDIARGGLRVVTPANSDAYAFESTRQYDEVYGLSYAQQLKNKDIPEGGSKAVVLVNTPAIAPTAKFFAMRKSVKAFTDTLLDMMVKDSVSQMVDKYGKDELIYLGPDEQIIPFDIDWICDRAAKRGYPIPAAFMSSKKDAGFNHKEFGVTSEGVVTFLDVALRKCLNIDPKKDKFTLKITGGPDGDVAGNLLKIVFREYGDNCKVLGIADGFGVAEDPEGLDSQELLRLFYEGLPITSFNTTKLSSDGVMMDISTEEGMNRRNSMVFRIKADAFVPAGGRPNTINGDNWRQFLDEDGKPTSSLIVEGANIFTTPEARDLLHKHGGVRIVKDSSANKCGVVTSSCEVQASMVLSKQEFLANKKELVADVLVKLKSIARSEAELLFREYDNFPGSLPHFSERISNAINTTTDAITDALADVNPEDPLFQELMPLIRDTLPKKLAELAWDRVPGKFPVQYQRNAIASTLASKLVYQEGIHLIETQPYAKLAERAFMYYRQDRKIRELADELEKSDVKLSKDKKDMAVDLLRRGGARTSINIF